MPYSPLRTPHVVYLGVWLVVSAVMARIRQGLSKIVERMADEDPIVSVAVGDGRLNRFRPNSSRARTRRSAPVPGTVTSYQSARLTVRSPILVSGIRMPCRKVICWLLLLLRRLRRRNLTVRRRTISRLYLSHSLSRICWTWIPQHLGGIVPSLPRVAIFCCRWVQGGHNAFNLYPTPGPNNKCLNVVYQSWLPESDREATTVDDTGVQIQRFSQVSPRDLRESKRILEALGNLSAATIAVLQCNGDCRVTAVLSPLAWIVEKPSSFPSGMSEGFFGETFR